MTTIKSHKFKAKPQDIDDIHFASKKESKHYQDLLFAQKAGEVVFFLRQVPFHLPGGSKYVCDFVVFWTDGNITFEEVKGYRTEVYKMKKRLVETLYPINLKEI